MTWKGYPGDSIHRPKSDDVSFLFDVCVPMSPARDDYGFIHVYKPGTERLLVLLHGTGGNERSLIELGQFLDASATLLSPRGKSLEEGAPRFFRRLFEGVFDLEDLHQKTAELDQFLTEAASAYDLNGKVWTAVGYSNGANIASTLAFLNPARFRSLVLLRPMVPFVPAAELDLKALKVLICAGRNDPIVPIENSMELIKLYQDHGAEVVAKWSSTGHSLNREELEEAQGWLARSR